MKTFAAAILVILSAAGAAQGAPAGPKRTPTELHGSVACSRGPLERVALSAAPCCNGLLACPQLLANTGLVKPKRPDRT